MDTGYCLEDLPGVMDDRDRWKESVREIHASCAIWWWWWLPVLIKKIASRKRIWLWVCESFLIIAWKWYLSDWSKQVNSFKYWNIFFFNEKRKSVKLNYLNLSAPWCSASLYLGSQNSTSSKHSDMILFTQIRWLSAICDGTEFFSSRMYISRFNNV